MQGCTLRCTWCDTPYALDHRVKEIQMTGQQILDRIEEIGCNFIEFTGGEPLEQFGVFPLMAQLCDRGYEVAVETGGHVDTSLVDKRVIKIMDIKCPDSKMDSLNYWESVKALTMDDEVKFVIASRTDYDYAKEVIAKYDLSKNTNAVLMSTVFHTITFEELVNWILEDSLNVRFQLQTHKFVWDPDTRGV